ncbi:MAG: hypothetical protein DHS20C02_03980 [Micavibrio sp.]|nr:MAG: hypothetical protein DHS20C02_03980 [Micavibrio sp.]
MPTLLDNKYIQIKRSTRARRLALRVDFKDRVIYLVVPKRTALKKAYAFAHANSDWIDEQLENMPDAIPYEDGAVLPLFGQDTQLDITYDSGLKRTTIALINNQLVIRTNKEDPSGRIERFLRQMAKDKFAALSHEKAGIIGKKVAHVTVRDTKTRWGSCDENGRLSYCWRLIFAPYDAMDYIVAHEVAHLEHLDHSTAFWNVCRDLSDNYVDGYYWIHNNGCELMRYGKAA